jgi:Protein of unknown function (DUF2442)
MATNEEFKVATERATKLQENTPQALKARYDGQAHQIVILFNTGVESRFPVDQIQGLQDASPSDLEVIKISPSGFGIHFPKLDVDLDVPGLVVGHFGSKKWMAASLGAAGGRSTSPAKRRAARANGALGGRPKQKRVRKAA